MTEQENNNKIEQILKDLEENDINSILVEKKISELFEMNNEQLLYSSLNQINLMKLLRIKTNIESSIDNLKKSESYLTLVLSACFSFALGGTATYITKGASKEVIYICLAVIAIVTFIIIGYSISLIFQKFDTSRNNKKIIISLLDLMIENKKEEIV